MSYTSEKLIDDRENGIFRVHRSLMTSPEIFAEEQRRIFGHCWLYIGHESEIGSPGDYIRRTVAGRPLIFLKDAAGTVRVFFNTCTHRGATLCREDSGNARVFQCFYHAWSFDTRGKLLITPGAEAYSPQFDKSDYDLRGPARVAGYRGLYFVNFDPGAPELLDYLGPATEYLDLVFDQAADGMRVVDGSHLYSVGSNWKLMVENSMDGYHAPTVHATYIDFVQDCGAYPTPWPVSTAAAVGMLFPGPYRVPRAGFTTKTP